MKDDLDFRSARRCFAIMSPEHLAWACGCLINDTCRDWLRMEYGTSDADYENIIHGFVHEDGYAVICKGATREKVNMNDIPEAYLKQIIEFACGYSGTREIEVHNGQYIGEPGELWEPIENLGKFTV